VRREITQGFNVTQDVLRLSYISHSISSLAQVSCWSESYSIDTAFTVVKRHVQPDAIILQLYINTN